MAPVLVATQRVVHVELYEPDFKGQGMGLFLSLALGTMLAPGDIAVLFLFMSSSRTGAVLDPE